MKTWRALLYMPGDDLHKINKAVTLGVDAICLDLEDGVSSNRKTKARQTIAKAIKSFDFGNSSRLIRINPINSIYVKDDLEAIIPLQPDGIVVPKIENPDQVKWLAQQLTLYEIQNGWQVGKIDLHIIIETTNSIINLAHISKAEKRIKSLIFGAEDLAANIGAVRNKKSTEVLFARSMVVLYASANALQSIDIVYFNFQDQNELFEDCKDGRQMGYTGKQVIHPNQVKIVQEAFTPTLDEIITAESLLSEYHLLKELGIGVFANNGNLVDAPVILAAENIIARAEAAGIYHNHKP